MCNICCHEFYGWCKSFTKIERVLVIVESALLIVFLSFLVFLILHLNVCSRRDELAIITVDIKIIEKSSNVTEEIHNEKTDTADCTKKSSETTVLPTDPTHTSVLTTKIIATFVTEDLINNTNHERDSDGEEVFKNNLVLALLKVDTSKPHEVIFKCVVTILSKYWSVTAASCLEDSDLESLETLFMRKSMYEDVVSYPVSEILIHPLYEKYNDKSDLAVLKTNDPIQYDNVNGIVLATILDYLLTVPGDRLTILVYGKFRKTNESDVKRTLREVDVYKLSSNECEASRRHLATVAPVPATSLASGLLCAGTLSARGLRCGECAGTPLLRGRVLLGVMRHNPQCGRTCEPAFYTNLAADRSWFINFIKDNQ